MFIPQCSVKMLFFGLYNKTQLNVQVFGHVLSLAQKHSAVWPKLGTRLCLTYTDNDDFNW